MPKGKGRRLYPEDVAAAMSEAAGRPIQVRTVTMALFQANHNRAVGYRKRGDIPVPDGREWRVPPADPLGLPTDSPWWRESTIERWLETRRAAAAEGRRQAARYFCPVSSDHDSGPGVPSRVLCRQCGARLVRERGSWGVYQDGALVAVTRQRPKADLLAGDAGSVVWLPGVVPERVAS